MGLWLGIRTRNLMPLAMKPHTWTRGAHVSLTIGDGCSPLMHHSRVLPWQLLSYYFASVRPVRSTSFLPLRSKFSAKKRRFRSSPTTRFGLQVPDARNAGGRWVLASQSVVAHDHLKGQDLHALPPFFHNTTPFSRHWRRFSFSTRGRRVLAEAVTHCTRPHSELTSHPFNRSALSVPYTDTRPRSVGEVAVLAEKTRCETPRHHFQMSVGNFGWNRKDTQKVNINYSCETLYPAPLTFEPSCSA